VTGLEWATCLDPEPMIMAIPVQQHQRELRQFTLLCARRIWHLLPNASREAVEALERFTEGQATDTEVEAVVAAAYREAQAHWSGGRSPDARAYAESAVGVHWSRPVTAAAVLSATSCAASATACAAADPQSEADYDRVYDAARVAELAAQAEVLRGLVRYPVEPGHAEQGAAPDPAGV
jgi:hypothetical protein